MTLSGPAPLKSELAQWCQGYLNPAPALVAKRFAVRGRRNHELTLISCLPGQLCERCSLQEPAFIPPRATRHRFQGFAALCAALKLLAFMRAWFDVLGRFELLARCAA